MSSIAGSSTYTPDLPQHTTVHVSENSISGTRDIPIPLYTAAITYTYEETGEKLIKVTLSSSAYFYQTHGKAEIYVRPRLSFTLRNPDSVTGSHERRSLLHQIPRNVTVFATCGTFDPSVLPAHKGLANAVYSVLGPSEEHQEDFKDWYQVDDALSKGETRLYGSFAIVPIFELIHEGRGSDGEPVQEREMTYSQLTDPSTWEMPESQTLMQGLIDCIEDYTQCRLNDLKEEITDVGPESVTAGEQ